jgi:hypothetical protein
MSTNDLSEFEPTGEPLEVERRPRAGAVISVRLSADEAECFTNVAVQRRMTVSALGREAIMEYLRHTPSGMLAASPWTGVTDGNSSLQLIIPTARPVVRTDGPPVTTGVR